MRGEGQRHENEMKTVPRYCVWLEGEREITRKDAAALKWQLFDLWLNPSLVYFAWPCSHTLYIHNMFLYILGTNQRPLFSWALLVYL